MNLVTLLEENAGKWPGRPALVDRFRGRDRVVTFGDLARRVSAGAAWLEAAGLRRGQVILVFQPVSVELYELLLAAFHRGLQVMLADPAAGRDFLALCCRRMPPDAFFGSVKAQWLRWVTGGMREIPTAISTGWFPGARSWRTDGVGLAGPVEAAEDDPALVTFTSGSTGVPKAAVRTHGFLLAQHRTLSRSLAFEAGEVDLITLPVFVLANLASGLTSVLAATDLRNPGSPDAAAIAAQAARLGVTRCAASPAFFEGLLGAGMLPAFGKIFTGGAPVFPDLLERLAAALPGADIEAVYGSTEAEPIAHLSAAETRLGTLDVTRRGGGLCAGRPVGDIELAILADRWGHPHPAMDESAFEALKVPPGQAGEIVVTGDHVLAGYLGGMGDGETKIHVAGRVWHRTGDAGWSDGDGRLWLLGRCAEKLAAVPAPAGLPADAFRYPFAIECALRTGFPGIRTAALEWRGKRTLVAGCATAPAGLAAAAETLGIERVIALDPLPLDRRHRAKIDYPALRACLERLPI